MRAGSQVDDAWNVITAPRERLVIRFLPGLLAAIVAYLVLPFFSWLDSSTLRFFLFLAIYAGVTIAVDQAMQRYKS